MENSNNQSQNEEINNSEEFLPHWKKILIREEFLDLYFNKMGLNENFKSLRLTDIYEINTHNKKELFHFAIIKTIEGEKNKKEINIQEYNQQIELKDQETINLINQNKLILFYPNEEDIECYDNSIYYLSLAYSGLVNSYFNNLQSSIFLYYYFV